MLGMTGSPAQASGPFTCRPGFYQVIAGHLKILNPLTGVYTDIGVDGDDYNAIGYNPADNYIYGWGTGGANSNNLIRVDSAGAVTSLGAAGVAAQGYFSGDFDDSNNLYLFKNTTTIVRINVANNPPTSTELTVTGGTFDGADMGWISNIMYAVKNATLYRLDLATLQVTTATIADLNSPTGKEFPTTGSHTYGAIFSNRENELYASNNGLGKIYRITDYNTANPKATWVTDATVTGNNDGAACKLAASPFSLPTAANDTYSAVNDTALTVSAANGVLANDSAAGPVVLSNTNPSGGTLTLNSNGSFTYQPVAGFVGSVTFTYVAQDQWGRSTGTATVTITVAAPTTTTTTTTAATSLGSSVSGSTTTTTPVPPTLAAAPAAEGPADVLPTTGSDIALSLWSVILGGVGVIVVRRRRWARA